MSDPDIYRRLERIEKWIQQQASMEVAAPYALQSYTPTYYGGTTAGVTTYTAQFGRYVVIDKFCAVFGTVGWSNATGTGNARVSLPVPVLNLSGFGVPVLMRMNSVTWTGATFQGLAAGPNDYFEIEGVSSNAGPTKTAVETAGAILYTLFYPID